jgi:hypothetical protein
MLRNPEKQRSGKRARILKLNYRLHYRHTHHKRAATFACRLTLNQPSPLVSRTSNKSVDVGQVENRRKVNQTDHSPTTSLTNLLAGAVSLGFERVASNSDLLAGGQLNVVIRRRPELRATMRLASEPFEERTIAAKFVWLKKTGEHASSMLVWRATQINNSCRCGPLRRPFGPASPCPAKVSNPLPHTLFDRCQCRHGISVAIVPKRGFGPPNQRRG